MKLECTQIGEWVEEEVSKPVTEWVEKTEEVCKNWPWPLNWLCKLVTTLVEVIVWVVEKVWKWVTRTVCKIVGAIIHLVVEVLTGLWDVIVGIFTLDWRRILDGLIKIGIAIVKTVFELISVIFLGDTIAFIISEIERYRLKEYVRSLLEKKYKGDELEKIIDNLRIDHGAFGYRISMSSVRTFVDSETIVNEQPAPNLVTLHQAGEINLYALCGFEFTEGFWNRKRYKTLKKGLIVTGGGGGEVTNPISREELDEYISSNGVGEPKFIVLPMTDAALKSKLKGAEEKGRELGLMINWKKREVEVTQKEHIVHNGFDTGLASPSLVSFLSTVIGRTGDISEICQPVAVGVFRYTDKLRGIAACLRGSSCQDSHRASGVTYIDSSPDTIWKFVTIHELGHYFGLCHVDGVDRIMYSPRQNSWFTWRTIPNLLYLQNDPKFTLSEAKQAWDYIVEHFPSTCLAGE